MEDNLFFKTRQWKEKVNAIRIESKLFHLEDTEEIRRMESDWLFYWSINAENKAQPTFF